MGSNRKRRKQAVVPLPEIHLHNILLHMMLLFGGFETYYVLSGDLMIRMYVCVHVVVCRLGARGDEVLLWKLYTFPFYQIPSL